MQNQIVVCWKQRPLPYWILLSKQLLSDWFSLVFFVFFSQSETIGNLHSCYRRTAFLSQPIRIDYFFLYIIKCSICTPRTVIWILFQEFPTLEVTSWSRSYFSKEKVWYLFISSAVTKVGLYLPELAPRRFFENGAHQIIFVKGAAIIWERRLFDCGA